MQQGPLLGLEARLMQTERPYPGQLWKHDGVKIIVVAVSPGTVTFQDTSERRGTIRVSRRDFHAFYKRVTGSPL